MSWSHPGPLFLFMFPSSPDPPENPVPTTCKEIWLLTTSQDFHCPHPDASHHLSLTLLPNLLTFPKVCTWSLCSLFPTKESEWGFENGFWKKKRCRVPFLPQRVPRLTQRKSWDPSCDHNSCMLCPVFCLTL